MIDSVMTSEQIGSVITMNGSVWAVDGDSQRPLTAGAPVYQGEEIVSDSDSNVEIKLADGTILGQGENSAIRLDDYVYSEDDNSLDFHMLRGVLRVVSGEIVKANPEGFNLTTPLATIGIRGTEIMVQIDQGREFIGVDKMGEGHSVIIGSAHNQVVIEKAGLFSGIDFDGSIIAPDEMPDSFISAIVRAAPLTVLGDPPRSPGDSQDVVPPQFYQTIDDQTGEVHPGAGVPPPKQAPTSDSQAPEELTLSEAEIAALLSLETAAGPAGPTTPGQSLGPVVSVQYTPYASTPSHTGSIFSTAGTFAAIPNTQSVSDPAPTTPDTPPPDTPPPPESPIPDTPPPDEQPPVDEQPPDQPPDEEPAADQALPNEQPPADEQPTGDSVTAPTAEDAVTVQDETEENAPVTYNVIAAGDATGDDGTTLVSATLAEDSVFTGAVSFTEDGTVTYTPVAGETGIVVIEYTVADTDGDTASAQLSILLAPDSVPTITTSDVSADESDGLVIATGTLAADFGADSAGSSIVLAADGATWDGDVSRLTADDHSWLIDVTGNQYEFIQITPFDHSENDSMNINVTITATDSDGSISTGDFAITVDDAGPTATDAVFVQEAEAAITYNVFSEDIATTGIDGGFLAAATLDADSDHHGEVAFETDGTINYTPTPGETGSVIINYTVADTDGDTASANLKIELADSYENDHQGNGHHWQDDNGGQGSELIFGTDGDDSLNGGAGNDTIHGTDGNDTLIGDNSSDNIFGGDGDDHIDGSKGNDYIVGGLGDDILEGGNGNDTFVFTSPFDGTDTILDFHTGHDQIDLYESTFDLLFNHSGTLSDNQFASIDADTYLGDYDFTDATSGLIYASEEGSDIGHLYYDPNDTVTGDEVLLAAVSEDGGDSNLVAEDIGTT